MNRNVLHAWRVFSNPARPQIAATEWLIIATLKMCPRAGCTTDELFQKMLPVLKNIRKAKPRFFLQLSAGCDVRSVLDFFSSKKLICSVGSQNRLAWQITNKGENYVKIKSASMKSILGDKVINDFGS